MKYKKLLEGMMLLLIILFLSLYLSQATGYYNYEENKKVALTEQAIKRFEQDVKEGKEIDVTKYLEEEANYNNIYSKAGRKLSSLIETSFQKIMTSLMNEVSNTINNS